jgi:guanylate kinase
LVGRATDAPEVIETRLQRAAFELSLAPQFDRIVVNDDLEQAKAEVLRVVRTFLDEA